MTTPIEDHGGMLVKREDLYRPDIWPNGKLRGLLPYLEGLRRDGVTTVVNAAATHSNSHLLVALAGREAGLQVVTVVNSDRHHPATEAAAEAGAEVILTRPMHLGPLKVHAGRIAAGIPGSRLLAWGLAEPAVIDAYAEAVAEVPPGLFDVHVVPMGAGGYAAGVWNGLYAARRLEAERVYAVSVMPTAGDWQRITPLLVSPWPRGLTIIPGGKPYPTPWVSDPRYEHVAWPIALEAALRGERALFWNVGLPCAS